MRVYFAGPLFTQAELTWNRAVADRLRVGGHEILLPQDDCAVCFPPHVPADATIDWRRVVDICIEDIEKADALVAVLDGPDPDSGTCFEVGYAFKKGVPIIGVRTDLRPGEVVEKGMNAMLAMSCAHVVKLQGEDVDACAREILAALAKLPSTQ